MTLFLICAALGIAAGLLAGVLGLGGGVVIVPPLIYLFHGRGFEADIVPRMAVATSLCTIIVTSISSVRAHHRAGYVRWPLALYTARPVLFPSRPWPLVGWPTVGEVRKTPAVYSSISNSRNLPA